MLTITKWPSFFQTAPEWCICDGRMNVYALNIEWDEELNGYIARTGHHYICYIPENKITKWEE